MSGESPPTLARTLWRFAPQIFQFLSMVLFLPIGFLFLWLAGTIRLGTFGLLLDGVSVLLLTYYPHDSRMRKLEPERTRFTRVILWWARALFIVGIALMAMQNENW